MYIYGDFFIILKYEYHGWSRVFYLLDIEWDEENINITIWDIFLLINTFRGNGWSALKVS